VAPQGRFRNTLLSKRLAEHVLVEFAVDTLEARDLGQLAVDEAVTHGNAVLFSESREGGAVDEAVEHLLKTAFGDKLLHRGCRALLLDAFQRPLGTLIEFVGGDCFAAGRGHRASTSAARRAAKADHVTAGERDGDKGEDS